MMHLHLESCAIAQSRLAAYFLLRTDNLHAMNSICFGTTVVHSELHFISITVQPQLHIQHTIPLPPLDSRHDDHLLQLFFALLQVSLPLSTAGIMPPFSAISAFLNVWCLPLH
ncbi:hypothetical protein KP509_13G061800 [Ceratopteris richardii]|uniref:Uncharacterized protein n=1 Tax=Ceratopteris richardii TaxID=49495 RepID=A0A8T2TFZ6_CERRI|nr:hypothetical protein KP509_13G061800 [Ceratopteris richardii]